MQKRNQKKIPKTHRKIPLKSSPKVSTNMVFRNVLEQKNSLHPKGPHSLKPTYSLRNNEVHVGQRRKRKSKNTSGTRMFNARKNIETVYIKKKQFFYDTKTKTPNVSLKA